MWSLDRDSTHWCWLRKQFVLGIRYKNVSVLLFKSGNNCWYIWIVICSLLKVYRMWRERFLKIFIIIWGLEESFFHLNLCYFIQVLIGNGLAIVYIIYMLYLRIVRFEKNIQSFIHLIVFPNGSLNPAKNVLEAKCWYSSVFERLTASLPVWKFTWRQSLEYL